MLHEISHLMVEKNNLFKVLNFVANGSKIYDFVTVRREVLER